MISCSLIQTWLMSHQLTWDTMFTSSWNHRDLTKSTDILASSHESTFDSTAMQFHKICWFKDFIYDKHANSLAYSALSDHDVASGLQATWLSLLLCIAEFLDPLFERRLQVTHTFQAEYYLTGADIRPYTKFRLNIVCKWKITRISFQIDVANLVFRVALLYDAVESRDLVLAQQVLESRWLRVDDAPYICEIAKHTGVEFNTLKFLLRTR